LLRAISLGATYDGEPLFAGVGLTVTSGDRIGLVGPNGVGKSTLLRLLVGAQAPDRGRVERAPGTRIGYYAQQVPDPDVTVGEYLAGAPGELAALDRELAWLTTALDTAQPAVLTAYAEVSQRYEQLGGWAYRSRVDAVRTRLGVAALAPEVPLRHVSGGEQARVMLARVLLAEPSVLVLDEPTNHLDADGTGWLAGYLAAFPGAVLVVTHDRAFLDRVVTQVVELDGIHLEAQLYTGNYTAYRQEKQRRWERLLLDHEAQEKARRRLAADIERTREQARGVEETVRGGPGMDKLRRYAKKVARKAKARERRLARQMAATTWLARPETRPGFGLEFAAPRDGEGPVLTGTDLTVHKRLSDVDVTVRAGDRILVAGRNGAGKSTLLRVLHGELAPDRGVLRRTAATALLPQVHDGLPAAVGVREFFRSRVPMYPQDAEATLAGYLFDADQWEQPVGTLSAGELRRLLLATMVHGRAPVLLLDEPTNYLDFDALDVVEHALRAFPGTVLMVTHDRYFADAVGWTRRWELHDGHVHEPGQVQLGGDGDGVGGAVAVLGHDEVGLARPG